MLKDGRSATIRFLNRKDSVRELQGFINSLVKEEAMITYDRETTLGEEDAWKGSQLAAFRKKQGYVIVAYVDGKLAGTSGANRERGRGRGNICLGLAIAKPFRGAGLGEKLLRANIAAAEKFFKPEPDCIYLSVLANNGPAMGLYRKAGFREFTIFPKWLSYKGKRIDHIFMKLG